VRQLPLLLAMPLLLTPEMALAQAAPATPAAPAPRAPAQPAPAAPSPDADDEEVVITGQKPRGSVPGDIPPEVTLNAADVRAYGVNNISDLLDQLSPQTTSGRGGQPVVLLNGRRISGFAEIRDLPTEAISRVEVLPEEVALKFGYTADQKVVNIVLRERFLALVGQAGASTSTAGGGTSTNPEANYIRIRGDNRLTANLRYQGSAKLLESQRDVTDVGPDGTDVSRYRTLRGSSQQVSNNLVYARPIFSRSTLTLNGSLSYATGDSLRGLPGAAFNVPAGDPFAPSGQAATVFRYLDTDPLHQRTDNLTAHAGVTVNGDTGKWRWSLTGNYDHGDSLTRTRTGFDTSAFQAQLTALDPTANPYAAFTPGQFGALRTNRAHSVSNTGNVQTVVGGPLLRLPAGDLTTNVKVGFEYTGFDANSTGTFVESSSLHRRNVNGQVNFDLPLTSRRTGVLPWMGSLSLNANLAVRRLSDFGTLTEAGGGFVWNPNAAINLIGSYTRDEDAPSVNQLGDPTVITPQVRVFDYARGQTVDVTQVSGGNPDLGASQRHVWKLGLTLKPFPNKNDLTIIANYFRTRTSNAIAGLPEPTSDLEAAFPDRFIRNSGGDLIRIDTRSVNFERERQDNLRFGLNFSINLKSIIQKRFEAWIAARRAGQNVPPPVQFNRFQPTLAGNKRDLEEARRRFQQRQPGQGQQPTGGQSANGQPTTGQPNANAQPPQGAPPAPPPGDAGGPPPGGQAGGPPPGGGGFGGGGFRGGGGGFGGGFGGGGFGRGGRGGGASGRLQVAIYDTWTIRDDVLIRQGVPLLDLLNGDAVGAGGGQSEHQLQLQLGYSNNGIGVRFDGNYKTPTFVHGDGTGTAGDLHFSGLATLNLRTFFDFGGMPGLITKGWARGLRVSVGVNNLFDSRQHVRDATGITPLRYQPAYLDPLGRTVSITIRKLIF